MYKISAATLIFLLAPVVHIFAQTADDIQTDLPALHEVFKDHFTFGVFLSYPHIGLPDDPHVPGQSSVLFPNGGYLVKHHMNFMGPGNNMKAQNTVNINASRQAYNNAATDAERDSINVHPVVRFNGNMIAQLNWAQRQGFKFRGHTLVWHNQTPGTAFFREGYQTDGDYLSPELMTERMSNYIRSVIKLLHEDWPGMVTAMDVVNEAVADGGLRIENNEWYNVYGDESYILDAFRLTRQHTEEFGETQMKLYYNDYNTHVFSKATAIVDLLTPVAEAGYLDGIGMQQHDQWNSPTGPDWRRAYDLYATIANEIAVTELDVNPRSWNEPPEATPRFEYQANQYAMLFKLFMEHSYGSGNGKIVNVTKDGLNDQSAFVADAHLFDADNQAKKAYFSVVDVATYYTALDTLLTYAEQFEEQDHSSDSWSVFSNRVQVGLHNFRRDYPYYHSASDILKNSYYNLLEAIEGLDFTPTGIQEEQPHAASTISLYQNYPNPFNPTTVIRFTLPEADDVALHVYNMNGQRVATLAKGIHQHGSHNIVFDGSSLSSGVYLYRLQTSRQVFTRKMVLVK